MEKLVSFAASFGGKEGRSRQEGGQTFPSGATEEGECNSHG